jgi:hypothetical protein
MARPERKDVDYFPFIVKDGRTLFVLESKYELAGIGFFTNLFRFLAKQPDHHICIGDASDRMYFFARVKCKDENMGMDMLDMMATTGKIDAPLWREKRVIASEDFLDSIKDAYKDRKNPIITINEIRALYANNRAGNAVSGGDNVAITEFPSQKEPDNTHTKLKDTKLKKSKGEGLPEREKKKTEKGEFNAFLTQYGIVIGKIMQKITNRVQVKHATNWAEGHFHDGTNRDALLHTLEAVVNSKKPIINMYKYLDDILSKENGNYNEREYQEEHKDDKGSPEEDKKALESLGSVLKGIIPAENHDVTIKAQCGKCNKFYDHTLVENGVCCFCNPGIITMKCPQCTRTVGKNILNQDTGLCIHCEPRATHGRI